MKRRQGVRLLTVVRRPNTLAFAFRANERDGHKSQTKKVLDPDARIYDFETEYELGQDNVRPFGLDIHNPVFSSQAS